MRIAQVAPLQVSIPPLDYGGTERCIAQLTEVLIQRGHDVTLYASGDSQTDARLVAPVPEALHFDPGIDATAYHVAMLTEVYRQAERFDVIHSHLEYHTLPFVRMSTTPTVLTLHGRLDKIEFQRVYRAYPDANYVAVSQSQQSWLPDLHWAGMVHHGVAVDAFPFSPHHGTYLAFVGRISPEKRPDYAIEVANRTGIPLLMAAKVDPADERYFRTTILPMIAENPLVEFIGPVNEQRKRAIMSHALALIAPIDWPEPFGIVFIEALACGTPVITRPYGAAPELLEDGVTGYLRETVEELAEAVLRIPQDISRSRCREYAQHRFDLRHMAAGYVQVYAAVQQHQYALPAWGRELSLPLDHA